MCRQAVLQEEDASALSAEERLHSSLIGQAGNQRLCAHTELPVELQPEGY